MKKENTTRKAQGCYRAGVPRPWLYKGGRKVAQDRYRKKYAEEIKQKKREEYQKNKEKYKEQSAKWRRKNPEKWKCLMRISNRRQRQKLRVEMVKAYGGKCKCCGETEVLFLELDHIHNDGHKDRKVNGAGVKLLCRLKKAGWPKNNYQILCSNCNHGKTRNGGICPHKTKNL
jgi:hypothetical protein